MTEDQKRLLAVFEIRVHDLITLCEEQKKKIDELYQLLNDKDKELIQTGQTIDQLTAKCENLLTARIVSETMSETEVKSARSRLSKLVREVDKCIALLNE